MDEHQKKLMFSSDSNEWETPPHILRWVEKRFGRKIGLDVASTRENKVCEKHFTKYNDAMSKPSWKADNDELTWMNPPYGRALAEWVKRAWIECVQNDARMVCLIPARTDTQYFHDYCARGQIFLLRRRIKFLQGGVEGDGAPFPSAIVHFAPGIYNVTSSISLVDFAK